MTTVPVGNHYLRDYAFAIPNGVQLAGSPRARAKYMAMLKRRGLTPGVSDIFISLPRGPFHGLYLELKHNDNTMSASQGSFQKRMTNVGYMATCTNTLEKSKDIVGAYLNM